MAIQKISKTYRFEASHYLPNHTGKCKRLHGHSYTVMVVVEGEVMDRPTIDYASRYGMVMDYAQLDKIVKPIISQMDHTHLYWDEDHDIVFSTLRLLEAEPFREAFTKIGARTTAENLAKFLFQSIFTPGVCGRFPNVHHAEVIVHETFKTSASYEGPTIADIGLPDLK